MNTRRSTPVIAIGAGALVVGAGYAVLAARSSSAADAATKGHVIAAPAQATGPQVGGLKVPDGHRAIAVQLESVPGTAGTASAGDHIDVIAAVTRKDKGDLNQVRMVLQGIEVLRTSGGPVTASGASGAAQNAANAAAGASSATTTFVLSVTPAEAEQLVYHAAFSKMWFDVVPPNQPAVPAPPAIDTNNALDPGVAK